MNSINSKTTFVTVNQYSLNAKELDLQHSKTTFVTVNLCHNKRNGLLLVIQKQPLLLLIRATADETQKFVKFKNNLCYC